jgi:hypothetical protein
MNSKNRGLVRYALFSSVLLFVTSSYALWIGYNKSKKGEFPAHEEIHNLGSELCTKATDIHFSWFFPYDALQGYRPMGFAWMLVATLPHFFREDSFRMDDWFGNGQLYGIFIILGWFVTVSFVGIGSPNWSFWCLHSVTYLIVPVSLLFKP